MYHSVLLLMFSIVTLLSIGCQHSESMSVLFSESDCHLPCFVGIIPGETEYSVAKQILLRRQPGESLSDPNQASYRIRMDPNGTLDVKLEPTDPRSGTYLSYIEISNVDKNYITTLGQLPDFGHQPAQVFRNRVAGPNTVNLLLVLNSEQYLICWLSATDFVDESSSIKNIMAVAPQDFQWRLTDLLNQQHYDDEIPWLGYTSVDQYLETAPISS